MSEHNSPDSLHAAKNKGTTKDESQQPQTDHFTSSAILQVSKDARDAGKLEAIRRVLNAHRFLPDRKSRVRGTSDEILTIIEVIAEG